MVNIQDNPLFYAAAGGIIIGLSTSINFCIRGNVTGMSGILYNTITLNKEQAPKCVAILGGMLLISGIFFNIFSYTTINQFTPFGPSDKITIYTSQLGFALAGILTGFGTKLSNGCTSGHGLCGLARLSFRSLVAVTVFLFSGTGIATIILYAGGLGPFTQTQYSPIMTYNHAISANLCIVVGVMLPLIGLSIRLKRESQQFSIKDSGLEQSSNIVTSSLSNIASPSLSKQFYVKDQICIFLVGLIFGAGLLVSGMVRRSNVINFLALGSNWNPSLMFVLGGGVITNLIFFTYMIKIKKSPFLGDKLFSTNNFYIDWKLIGGALCFGLGWGIGGLCPGPAIMQSSIFTIDVHLLWFPFFFMGQLIANKVNQTFPDDSSKVSEQQQTNDISRSELISPKKTKKQEMTIQQIS